MKGWIRVFIPDVVWRKFGNGARCASAELFLQMEGLKPHLHHGLAHHISGEVVVGDRDNML